MQNNLNQLQIALQSALDNMQIALNLCKVLNEQIEQLDNENEQSQIVSVVLPERKETP